MESGAYYFRQQINYTSVYHLNDAKRQSEIHKCGTDSKWLDCLRKVDPKEIMNHNSLQAGLIFGTDTFHLSIDDALKTGKFHTGM